MTTLPHKQRKGREAKSNGQEIEEEARSHRATEIAVKTEIRD